MFFHVKRLVDTPLPVRATGDSVGYDLFAPADGYIPALDRRLIKLGFEASFTAGYAGLLLDRSGMGNKGLTRFAGVIDPDYRGEWGVILFNSTPIHYHFKRGDRIIQVLFLPVGLPDPQEVFTLEDSSRGDRGLGSSGV